MIACLRYPYFFSSIKFYVRPFQVLWLLLRSEHLKWLQKQTLTILFIFHSQGAVEDIRFLDWQLARYASPATDLIHNLFTSTDKQLRDNEFDNLLKLYYDTLSKTVRLLGSVPEELFTFESLQDELKKCGNLALILAPLVIQYSQIDPSEITNVHEACGQTSITDLNKATRENYERRVNDLLEEMFKKEYYRAIG